MSEKKIEQPNAHIKDDVNKTKYQEPNTEEPFIFDALDEEWESVSEEYRANEEEFNQFDNYDDFSNWTDEQIQAFNDALIDASFGEGDSQYTDLSAFDFQKQNQPEKTKFTTFIKEHITPPQKILKKELERAYEKRASQEEFKRKKQRLNDKSLDQKFDNIAKYGLAYFINADELNKKTHDQLKNLMGNLKLKGHDRYANIFKDALENYKVTKQHSREANYENIIGGNSHKNSDFYIKDHNGEIIKFQNISHYILYKQTEHYDPENLEFVKNLKDEDEILNHLNNPEKMDLNEWADSGLAAKYILQGIQLKCEQNPECYETFMNQPNKAPYFEKVAQAMKLNREIKNQTKAQEEKYENHNKGPKKDVTPKDPDYRPSSETSKPVDEDTGFKRIRKYGPKSHGPSYGGPNISF